MEKGGVIVPNVRIGWAIKQKNDVHRQHKVSCKLHTLYPC